MNHIKITPEIMDRLSNAAHHIEMASDDTWYPLRAMFEQAQVTPADDIPTEITELLEIRELLDDAYDKLIRAASPF